MTTTDTKRWRGLKNLLRDAVEQGASAIERVHLETARRPFGLLERIPAISQPVQGVHLLHDAIVSASYGTVRVVARAAGDAVDVALDSFERDTSSAD